MVYPNSKIVKKYRGRSKDRPFLLYACITRLSAFLTSPNPCLIQPAYPATYELADIACGVNLPAFI